METRDIKVGEKSVRGVSVQLSQYKLIAITGSRGFIMCGYLDMAAADKFSDIAVKVTGVKTIDDVLNSCAVAVSRQAQVAGISVGQPIREILSIIA